MSPATGTLDAPGRRRAVDATRGGDHGFADVFSDAAAGEGVLLLLLLAAFGWGAVHALSPGHGKAMVAAYLVGTRGTAAARRRARRDRHRDAHDRACSRSALVTLLLSQYILPEDLYPVAEPRRPARSCSWSALAVLRSRIRWTRARHATSTTTTTTTSTTTARTTHARPRRTATRRRSRPWRGLLAMGAAAGLIPCPSALVVLLGAIAQGQIALGMLLIVAFSAGLAMTLTALGLAVVFAGRRSAGCRSRAASMLALPPCRRC